jgi:hypothetical protein
MDHVSPLTGSLVDDSLLVVVDLSSSPSDVGQPICTPPSTSSTMVRQSTRTPSSFSPSSVLDVSPSPLFLDEFTTTPNVQPSDTSPSCDAWFSDDTFHLDEQLLDYHLFPFSHCLYLSLSFIKEEGT